MNEDMSEIVNKLGSMLNNNEDNSDNNSGSPSISPEMISGMLEMLNSKNSENDEDTNRSTENSSIPNIDFETILKFKNAFDKMNSKDDPRSKLLLALKPYLKETRQEKVEQYIQLFNMSKIIDIFGHNTGGDAKKWCLIPLFSFHPFTEDSPRHIILHQSPPHHLLEKTLTRISLSKTALLILKIMQQKNAIQLTTIHKFLT